MWAAATPTTSGCLRARCSRSPSARWAGGVAACEHARSCLAGRLDHHTLGLVGVASRQQGTRQQHNRHLQAPGSSSLPCRLLLPLLPGAQLQEAVRCRALLPHGRALGAPRALCGEHQPSAPARAWCHATLSPSCCLKDERRMPAFCGRPAPARCTPCFQPAPAAPPACRLAAPPHTALAGRSWSSGRAWAMSTPPGRCAAC